MLADVKGSGYEQTDVSKYRSNPSITGQESCAPLPSLSGRRSPWPARAVLAAVGRNGNPVLRVTMPLICQPASPDHSRRTS